MLCNDGTNAINCYCCVIRHEQFVGASVLQAGRSRVRFLKGALEFFIDIILPVALWLWGRLRF